MATQLYAIKGLPEPRATLKYFSLVLQTWSWILQIYSIDEEVGKT